MNSLRRHMRILLVEDNSADVLMLRELFADVPNVEYSLTEVDRLAQAADLLRREEFDAVLLDLGLPDSQGLQTFVQLHKQVPETPVLVLTALDDEATGIRALQHGAQDYLVKGQFQGSLLGRSVRYAVERHHIAAELRQSQSDLRRLATRLEDVREEERTRISRQIHDELGQMLTGLSMDLHWVDRRLVPGLAPEGAAAIKTKLAETDTLAQSTIQAMQKLAVELRPGTLDHLGLAEAIREEARRFEGRMGVAFSLALPDDLPKVPTVISTAFFRIYQELLTNVARHAQAQTVQVRLNRDQDFLTLEVFDNGRGFDPKTMHKKTSLGLLGMSERVLSLNGKINVDSAPQKGTRVTVRIPLAA